MGAKASRKACPLKLKVFRFGLSRKPDQLRILGKEIRSMGRAADFSAAAAMAEKETIKTTLHFKAHGTTHTRTAMNLRSGRIMLLIGQALRPIGQMNDAANIGNPDFSTPFAWPDYLCGYQCEY